MGEQQWALSINFIHFVSLQCYQKNKKFRQQNVSCIFKHKMYSYPNKHEETPATKEPLMNKNLGPVNGICKHTQLNCSKMRKNIQLNRMWSSSPWNNSVAIEKVTVWTKIKSKINPEFSKISQCSRRSDTTRPERERTVRISSLSSCYSHPSSPPAE